MLSLRSSARDEGWRIDFHGIVDPKVDIGIPAGRELVALGRAASSPAPSVEAFRTLAAVVGTAPAVTAVEFAGAFSMTNRIMEATGQPVLANQRQRMLPILEQLGALDFPHSGLTTEVGRTRWQKLVKKVWGR